MAESDDRPQPDSRENRELPDGSTRNTEDIVFPERYRALWRALLGSLNRR